VPVTQVVHSVCPSIFGHNLVKLALALSLFGGIVKHVGTDNPDKGTDSTDNPTKGTDSLTKGTDNLAKGTDNSDKSADQCGEGFRPTYVRVTDADC
jgi:hypothetical protein